MEPQRVVTGVFADDARHFQPRSRAIGRAQASPFGFWRFIGVAVSTLVLLVTVPMYFNLVFDDLTSAYQEPGPLMLWIAATVAVGLVVGAGIMWWAARAYAKIVAAILSVTFITTGIFMLVFAPVYLQVNTRGIAEYRASNAMLLFGTLTTASGVALAVLCMRWALDPEALRALNRWRRPAGAAYGVLLGLLGLLLLGLLALGASSDASVSAGESGTVLSTVIFTSIGMMFLAPAVILVFHGISSSMGERSAPFVAPAGALMALGFGVVLAAGGLNMALEKPIAAPMPVLHTLAAAGPGLAYMSFAARGSFLGGSVVRGLTWRQVTLAWALAIAVGVVSAAALESVGGLWVTILLLVRDGAFDGVTAIATDNPFGYDVFDVIGEADVLLSDREQWFANIIAIAVMPPLFEEFFKGLSVRFVMRRMTTRGQAFLLGVTAGAGFGFVEALLYGVGGVSEDLGFWWLIMLMRAGSTSLHSLNTGFVGLAWWHWSIQRRWRPASAFFGLAVVLHAIWNGFYVTLMSELPWVGTLDSRTVERVVYVFVSAMALALIVAIPLVARRLREPPPPPVETTPLAAMVPWIA
jgi:RsiW-degrading membrane proteinase PrsW (M82 family)